MEVKNHLYFNSRKAFIERFLSKENIKILDVGNLGDGFFHVDVKSILDRNQGEYFGLDCNKNLTEKLGLSNQIIGDLHNVPVADDSFDYIYAGEIVEHSWQPSTLIKECHRILKKNGVLVLDTPNVYDFITIFRLFFKKINTMGDVRSLTYNEAKDDFSKMRADNNLFTQPQHKIFYSPAMLEQLLNMHGFVIDHIAYIGKPRNIVHKMMLKFFPQGSQKIGIVAHKENLETIFGINGSS